MNEMTQNGPQTASGTNGTAANNQDRLWDKRDVAGYAGLTTRSVDNLLREGLPHFKVGKRRVRFDPPEVREWFRRKFAVRRIGPALRIS